MGSEIITRRRAWTYSAAGDNTLTQFTLGQENQAVQQSTIAYAENVYGVPTNWTNGRALTWRNGTDLTSIGGVTFTYDDGQRLTKTAGGITTEYTYEGDKLVLMKRGSDRLFFVYDAAGLVGFDHITSQGTNTYYYRYDGKGEIVALTNASGTVVANYSYDAWGADLGVTDASGNAITDSSHIAQLNPFRYKSYCYDTETGLYYLNSRYYDPIVCRFISMDNQLRPNNMVGMNLFAYCGNNPVMRIDPSGKSFLSILGLALLIGGIVLGTSSSSAFVVPEKEPIDPSVPPPPSSGYVPPKNNPNPRKVPNPNGAGKGWPSKGGGVWVPNNKQHGGPGWTEQFPDGTHRHHYPDGHVREASLGTMNIDSLLGTGMIILGVSLSAYVVANDVTGIGVIDTGLLYSAGNIFAEGSILLFG